TTYTVTTPAHAVGLVDVTYTNGADSATLTSSFLYTNTPPPTITNVSPNSGPTAGGTQITITGTNFRAPLHVDFGPQNGMTKVTVLNANIVVGGGGTTLTLTTPAAVPTNATGFTTLTVVDEDVPSQGTLASAFKYTAAAPTVTAISPDSGPF